MERLFLALALLFGCVETPPPTEAPPLPAAAPVPEPKVDTTFMNPAAVVAWRSEIVTMIEGDAAAPHPREVWKFVTDYRVDRSKLDPILGDPKIWDAATTAVLPTDSIELEVPAPRADEALALEARDEEYDAAMIWIQLGRMEDAKRCSAELEKESEWRAVSLIAVYTGDLAALDRATKKMVDASQVSRTREVVRYAFESGKIDIANHIAKTHGWDLGEILNGFQIRDLALRGDASILLGVLDREISAWERGDLQSLGEYPGPEIIVADIVLLAKTDRVKALEYVRRYLALPNANVLIWTECGEGCYSSPVAGTLELYQLIRTDQVLRDLYLARTRQAVNDMFPVEQADEQRTPSIEGISGQGYTGWGLDMWGANASYLEGNLLLSYLVRVRALGDSELTRFWVEMLDTFPKRTGFDDRTLDFEREVGRYALGQSFSPTVGNLSPLEKLILEDLQSRANTRLDDTWAAWDMNLPDDKSRREIEHMFIFLTRGNIASARETAIRTELGIEQTPGEETELHWELRMRFGRSLEAHYGIENYHLSGAIGKARRALRTNAEAVKLRQERGLPEVDLYPDTDAELDELLAPSLELLCGKVPAKCSLYRPEPAVASTP